MENIDSKEINNSEGRTRVYWSKNVVGKSPKMKKLYELVETVSQSDSSIHIQGEDGSGKDTLAEYIHDESGRSGTFVVVNPIELNDVVASLGFNKVYEYFLKAKKGTVYIPDITSANIKLQEYLLNSIIKVEQELGMFCPRFISSTNKNISDLLQQNRFNQRLRDSFSLVIEIPSLRERREDFDGLIKVIMKECGYFGRKAIPISQEAYNALVTYDWPGNVRQLSNAVNHFVKHAVKGVVTISSLPAYIRKKETSVDAKQDTINELYKFAKILLESGENTEGLDPYFEYLKAIERPLIQAAIDLSNGNYSKASKLIRINRNTFYKKMKLYNIDGW